MPSCMAATWWLQINRNKMAWKKEIGHLREGVGVAVRCWQHHSLRMFVLHSLGQLG